MHMLKLQAMGNAIILRVSDFFFTVYLSIGNWILNPGGSFWICQKWWSTLIHVIPDLTGAAQEAWKEYIIVLLHEKSF